MPSLPSSPSRRGRSRGLDADDARSRRNENKIELRKAKKDETLAKRRFAQPADAAAEEPTDPAAAAADAVANACCRRRCLGSPRLCTSTSGAGAAAMPRRRSRR